MYLIEVLRRHADFIVLSNAGHVPTVGTIDDWRMPNPSTDADLKVVKDSGHTVDIFFNVTGKELYPQGYHKRMTRVEVPGVSEGLCSDRRPGFFNVVTTPVLKMFNIITPDVTVFGEKDYQQYAVIKKMVQDLHLPIDVIPAPTLRYKSGLALASRNAVFTPDELDTAQTLYRVMDTIRQAILAGRRDYEELIEEGKAVLMEVGMTPDYISIREPETLKVADKDSVDWIVFGAAYFGADRMVDTLRVCDEPRDPVLDTLPQADRKPV